MLTIIVVAFLVSLDVTWTAPAEGVSPFTALVEEEALKIPEDSLAEDQLLTQEVVQGSTIYRHVKSEKHGAPVFIRAGSDEGKAVVVLQAGEDYLSTCKAKRTFVVLKQSSGDKKVYRAFYAYVRETNPQRIEWDGWFPRGNPRNKALIFGFVRCSKSSMIPCKKELQVVSDDSADYEEFGAPSGTDNLILPPLPHINYPPRRVFTESGNDYFCDLREGENIDSRFTGAVIGSLAQSTIVLTGAELVYKDPEELIHDVQKDIKAVTKPKMQGRTMGSTSSVNNVTEVAATKLIDLGRQTVAGGTILFYAAVVKVGALALHQVPPNEEVGGGTANAVPASSEDKTLKYKTVGLSVLRGFFQGVSNDDPEQPRANPNPEELLKESVAANLMAGRRVGDTGEGPSGQSGRGMLSWLTGKADIGTSSSNGEQAVRHYKGAQRDGSVTGSKGVDNLNFAIDNAFGGTRKSAGQVFSENIVAGVYMPYGLIEDAGDALGGSILGIGRVSDDRSYVDDILDKAMNVVAGAGGQVVDVVGDILGPIGLGGLWTGVAGVAAGTLGAIGGGIASPVLGVYELVKMGAKAVGIGGIIGMHGGESRQQNLGGNQNVERYSPPSAPGFLSRLGRRRRSPPQQDQNLVSITDVDLFSHMGWRTMDISQQSLHNQSYAQEEPFIGFGNCIYKKPSVQDFESASGTKPLIKLYAQTLRVQCLGDQIEILNDIVSKGYLTLAPDKTFSIPSTLPALTKAKLSPTEINELSKAFEMSVYTKTHALTSKSSTFKLEGNSASVSFLKLMTLALLEEVSKTAPGHYIKISRNVAKILKTGFTKSLQDFFRYKHCRKCQEDKLKESLNDAILLLALTEFVLVEQEKAEFNSGEKLSAFDRWYLPNRQSISQRMSFFFV